MAYVDQWKRIAARISGLVEAGKLHASFAKIRTSGSTDRARPLRAQCEGVLVTLIDFNESYPLPAAAKDCIDKFIAEHAAMIRDDSGTGDALDERVWRILVALGAFVAELSFLLADQQQEIRAKSELAFAHLQRLIVADPDVRRKWIDAFRAGEGICEQLGAVHLLGHGIYAFKAHGRGERTDLVFRDTPVTEAPPYAAGLVLTEWKVCNAPAQAPHRYAEARAQAALYGVGVLGGIELATYRYAVIVSEKPVGVPNDIVMDGVTYRHVNIVVDPDNPSTTARARRA